MDPRSQLPPLVTVTSTSLLEGLRDEGDGARWQAYVERYRPLIVRYGRRIGLGAEDAEDLAQASLLAFAQSYRAGRYDRSRGRLRAWLFGIVGNQLRSANRARRHREVSAPDSGAETGFFERVPDDDTLSEAWEEEWRQAVVRQCLSEVRREVEDSTFAAFRAFALEERPASEVAAELGLTINAVYGAKRRVLARMRGLRPLLEDVW